MKQILLIAALLLPGLRSVAQNQEEIMYALPDTVIAEEITVEVAADTTDVQVGKLSDEGIAAAIAAARDTYPGEWNRLSMDGKLTMEELSIKPTVKIYMERDRSVILSVRAPFVGEVARVEVCPDSITMINKMSKKYMSLPIGALTRRHPGIISDIQDILLGNMSFPGYGIVTPQLAPQMDWILTPEGEVYVYPGEDMLSEGLEYGFLLDASDYELLAFILMLPGMDGMLQAGYTYYEKDWTLRLDMLLRGYPVECELQLSYPDFNPTAIQLTEVGGRYSRTDLRGLLKF